MLYFSMIIWFASGNMHKKNELSVIFAGHTLKIPADAGITGFDPPETGTSFAENALIKAAALYDMLNENPGRPENFGPVLADDSGLCVDALGGRPGIYSARYYGKDSWDKNGNFRSGRKAVSDGERNTLLLEELAVFSRTSHSGTAAQRLRRCRFVCAMVLFFGKDRFYLAQETLEGEIVPSAAEIRGRGGFGYDPIVYLPELGCTVAELPEDEKNRLSHRGKAGRIIAKLL